MAGSSAGSDADPDPRSPDKIAREARNQALGAFDEAADADDIAERAGIEQEAARDFAESMAAAIIRGLSRPHVRSTCGQLSDASKFYTKSDLADLIQEAVEDEKQEQDSRRTFDEIITDDLTEVVIVRTTDAKQSTLYRWQFNGASVETTATSEGRTHFSWSDFRDEYFDAIGEDPAKPTSALRGGEEWREFIVDIVEGRGREVTTRGPRSSAVDGLQNFIRRSRAYGEIEDMVERDGLYLDDAPDADPSELWVPNNDIKRICDEFELGTVRELQLELDARGYTVERIDGVSESTFVNNNKITYWVLDPKIADPADYVTETADPAEQVEAEEAAAEEDDQDDGAESEPGEIGSFGTDPDAEEDTDSGTDTEDDHE